MRMIVRVFAMFGALLFLLWVVDVSRDLEVVRQRLGPEGEGPGMRIAQISDLHMVGGAEVEEKVLVEVAREDPDLLLLTGDILTRRDRKPALQTFLQRLGGRSKKFAIPGNWEYFAGMDVRELRAFYARQQVTLLVNEAVVVEGAPHPLLLVGLDDAIMGRPDWRKAMAWQSDWRGAVLILAHNPVTVEHLPPSDPRLAGSVMLSGHTHGGQIVLFGRALTPTGMRDRSCMSGWCQTGRGVALYVSRGVGTSVLPLRIGSRPELTLFHWFF